MGMLSLSTKADDAKQSLSRCTAEQKHRRVAKEQKQEDCRYLLKTHAMQYLTVECCNKVITLLFRWAGGEGHTRL